MKNDSKLIIIMVGLPARGKSYTSNKIKRYLSWLGYNVKIFNVGNYRRELLGNFQNFNFFDINNIEASKIRENIASKVFLELIEWISNSGDIGIFDATNTTIYRRNMLDEICKKNKYTPLYIENICYDNNVIRDNLLMKLNSPDYKDIKEHIAKRDFYNRLRNYSDNYKKLSDTENRSFIKIKNNFESLHIFKLNRLIEKEILSYLIYVKINKFPIYLTRHGESEYNTQGLIGGNSCLSEKGKLYISKLNSFIESENGRILKFLQAL